MRFYYFSVVSWLVYAIYAAIALAVVSVLWKKGLGLRLRNPGYWVLLAAVLVAPWIEELWIAYQFDRLCRKDAGVHINSTVEVEGFYDDTHGWTADKLRGTTYRFVEGRVENTIWRHEYVGNEIRSFKIDRPSARYYYKQPHNHTPVAHKVTKVGTIVVDTKLSETIATETTYVRQAYWFFIGLDRPVMLCPAPGEDPLEKYGAIYNAALKPNVSR